jgi:hypothetical protein
VTWKEKLCDMWESSTITTSVITLMVVLTVCILYLTNRSVPPELFTVFGAIIGFFLRGKVIEVSRSVVMKKQA